MVPAKTNKSDTSNLVLRLKCFARVIYILQGNGLAYY